MFWPIVAVLGTAVIFVLWLAFKPAPSKKRIKREVGGSESEANAYWTGEHNSSGHDSD